jgi:hypothetical protein
MTTHIAICGHKEVGKSTFINAFGLLTPFNANIALYPKNLTFNMFTHKRPMKVYEIPTTQTLIENSILFDIVVFMIDDRFTFDKLFFELFIEKVLSDKSQYNKNTKLLFCINKCDILDYELDDGGNLEFINDSKEKFDELTSYLTKIQEDKKVTITTTCMMGELIYAVRILKNDEELDSKYFELLGETEFGKQKWRKFRPDQRKSQIASIVKSCFKKSESYIERMKQYGFIDIQKYLKASYDEIIESTPHDNKFKYITSRIVTHTFDNIHDNIRFYSLMGPLPKELQIALDKNIIELYMAKYPIEKLDHSNVVEYETAITTLAELYTDYMREDGTYDAYTRDIIGKITSLYTDNILASTDMEFINNSIKILKRYNYKDLSICVNRLLELTIDTSKWVDDPDVLLKYLEHLLGDDLITNESCIGVLFNCLVDRLHYMANYRIYNTVNSATAPTINTYATYCCLLEDFLEELRRDDYYYEFIVLKETLQYSKRIITDMQLPRDFLQKDLVMNRNNTLKLEHYLLSLMNSDVIIHPQQKTETPKENQESPDKSDSE